MKNFLAGALQSSASEGSGDPRVHGWSAAPSGVAQPRLPLGPAPAVTILKTITAQTFSHLLAPGGIQKWAHKIRYRSTKLRPCEAAWSLPPQKAFQPTSLYWVSGLHLATLGETPSYLDTIAPAFGAK